MHAMPLEGLMLWVAAGLGAALKTATLFSGVCSVVTCTSPVDPHASCVASSKNFTLTRFSAASPTALAHMRNFHVAEIHSPLQQRASPIIQPTGAAAEGQHSCVYIMLTPRLCSCTPSTTVIVKQATSDKRERHAYERVIGQGPRCRPVPRRSLGWPQLRRLWRSRRLAHVATWTK